jgi:hypothetical protein
MSIAKINTAFNISIFFAFIFALGIAISAHAEADRAKCDVTALTAKLTAEIAARQELEKLVAALKKEIEELKKK